MDNIQPQQPACAPSAPTSQKRRRPNEPEEPRKKLERHKEGKDISEQPAYQAQNLFTGTSATSRHDGKAAGTEHLQKERRKQVAKDTKSSKNKNKALSDEENAALDPDKRRYSGDIVSLPEYPPTSIDDYSKRADGKWRCMHESYKCAEASCKHPCCRDGYASESRLNAAIRKGISTWQSRVERLIDDEKLDKRHRTWKIAQNKKNRREEKEVEEAAEGHAAEAKEQAGRASEKEEQKRAAEAMLNAGAEAERQAAIREEAIKNNEKALARDYREACFRESRKTPEYQNQGLFDAWWNAQWKKARLESLRPEEQALLQQPEPSRQMKKKPVTKQIPPAVSTLQDFSNEDSTQIDDEDLDSLFNEAEPSTTICDATGQLNGDPELDEDELDAYIR